MLKTFVKIVEICHRSRISCLFLKFCFETFVKIWWKSFKTHDFKWKLKSRQIVSREIQFFVLIPSTSFSSQRFLLFEIFELWGVKFCILKNTVEMKEINDQSMNFHRKNLQTQQNSMKIRIKKLKYKQNSFNYSSFYCHAHFWSKIIPRNIFTDFIFRSFEEVYLQQTKSFVQFNINLRGGIVPWKIVKMHVECLYLHQGLEIEE